MEIRVLFITHYASIGGANIAMLRLINELKRYGVVSYIVFPDNGDAVENAKENNIGCTVIPYANWVTDRKGIRRYEQAAHTWLYNQRAVRKICKYAIDNNINMIHSNTSFTCVGAYVAWRLKLPHIWHIRELLGNYGYRYMFSYRYVQKHYSHADARICISQFQREMLESNGFIKDMKMVYDGVPLGEYYTHQYDISEQFILLYAGGNSKEKGYRDVVEAVKILNDYRYNNIIHCIMAIGKDENNPIITYIKENNLQGYFTTYESIKDITAIRKKVHIFLMCSRHEAFGLVTAEAMMEGLPVIGARAGATSELIKDNQTGMLYKVGDSEELARKILFARNNYSEMQRMAQEARKQVANKFSAEVNGKTIADIYKKTSI